MKCILKLFCSILITAYVFALNSDFRNAMILLESNQPADKALKFSSIPSTSKKTFAHVSAG